MAVFNVFEHPDRGLESASLVREGFSSPAFVFTVLWALWHRMWIVAAALLLLLSGVSLAGVNGYVPEAVASVLGLGISLLFGFEAAALRGLSLRRSGYAETAVVSGESVEEAELKLMFSRAARPSPPPEPLTSVRRPPHQPPSEPLGLFGNV